MNLGENIKKFRKEKKWTQQQLSEISGIPKISLGRYERNETKPPISVLTKLATALQVPIDVLCGMKNIDPIVNLDLGLIEGFVNNDTGEVFENMLDYIESKLNLDLPDNMNNEDDLPDEMKYSIAKLNEFYDDLLNIFKDTDIEFAFYMHKSNDGNITLKGKLTDHKDNYVKIFDSISEVEKFYKDIKFTIQSVVDRLKYLDKNNEEGADIGK